MKTKRVLLVEDESVLALDYSDYIESLGYAVVHARNALKAIEVLHPVGKPEVFFDAVITDMRMPGGSGLTLLQTQNERRDSTPCLVHSSETTFKDGNVQLDNLAKISGIFAFAQFHKKEFDYGYIKNFLELSCS